MSSADPTPPNHIRPPGSWGGHPLAVPQRSRHPFDRLWFKLISAFALVIGVGVLVTVVLTRQGAATQFAHFMVANHMIRPVRLQAVLAEHYALHSGWDHVDESLVLLVNAASDGTMRGMMGNMMGMYNNRIQVVDESGAVVADSEGPAGSARLTDSTMQSWPISRNGSTLGELLVAGGMMHRRNDEGATLLSGVTRAVLVAGLIAGAVALILAGLLVRQVTRPLAALAQASHQIAAGDRTVRVPVQSKDEVGELAIIFNQMTRSLETQETLRRHLMADIAHELRTPLAGIQGTVEAIQDGVFPWTDESLDSIHEQVLFLNRLVEDLRTLANAEAGQLALALAPLDLAELARRTLVTFQPQATVRQVDLSLTVAQNLPSIHADQQRLGQVLTNLLDNALRHTPARGEIEVALSAEQTGVRIAIIDSGEGIAPLDLPHIFDRFYRADGSRNWQTGGSGLGLAIARQLVEAQGGKIWAESPPVGRSQGSAFIIALSLYGDELSGRYHGAISSFHEQFQPPYKCFYVGWQHKQEETAKWKIQFYRARPP